MAISARELSEHVNTFQVMFFRSAFGLVIVTLSIAASGKLSHFTTARFRLHTTRNLFHFAGQYGWLVGIAYLPLAQVFALEFTVPLWTALIAWLFLGEALTRHKSSAIVLGLVGVVIIVKPGIEVVNSASLIVLGAAFCYSISHTATKSLSSIDAPITIIFYMSVIQMPLGLILAIDGWKMPQGIQWLWLALMGVLSLSAHFCMAKAMQHADVTLVVIMDYLRLPAIGLVGVLMYGESLELSLLVGALIMLLGNVLALVKARSSVNQQLS